MNAITAAAPSTVSDIDPIEPLRLLNLIPGLVCYIGTDQRYRFANETYARWRGLEPTELIGLHCREVVGEAAYAAILPKLEEALLGLVTSYEIDMFDGWAKRHVHGVYRPDFGPDGEVVGILALVTDVSERQDLQRKIEESQAIFDQAFHNAPNCVAVLDASGVIRRANPALGVLLGRSPDELAGVHIHALTHPDDIEADLALMREVAAGLRNGFERRKRYIRPDGTLAPVRTIVSVARDAAGAPRTFVTQIEPLPAAT